MKFPKYYKVLNLDGQSPYQKYYWPLPSKGKPGTWVKVFVSESLPLKMCSHGLHFCTYLHLGSWRGFGTSKKVYAVEVDPKAGKVPCTLGDDKVVFAHARLLYRIPRTDLYNIKHQKEQLQAERLVYGKVLSK